MCICSLVIAVRVGRLLHEKAQIHFFFFNFDSFKMEQVISGATYAPPPPPPPIYGFCKILSAANVHAMAFNSFQVTKVVTTLTTKILEWSHLHLANLLFLVAYLI